MRMYNDIDLACYVLLVISDSGASGCAKEIIKEKTKEDGAFSDVFITGIVQLLVMSGLISFCMKEGKYFIGVQSVDDITVAQVGEAIGVHINRDVAGNITVNRYVAFLNNDEEKENEDD